MEYYYTGKPGDHAKITNVSIVPDPPVIGKHVNISATLSTGTTHSYTTCVLILYCILLQLKMHDPSMVFKVCVITNIQTK